MAVRYECDRCHQQFEAQAALSRLSWDNGYAFADLCGTCQDAINCFVKEGITSLSSTPKGQT